MEQLEFNKTKKLLGKYKLLFAKSDIAKSEEQAIKSAKKIGFPVVLKLISKEIIHKTEEGAVITDINSEEEAKEAYNSLMKKTKKKIEGILVQKMEIGKEVIIGMKRDPQFDAVIMFGLGGIFVEVLKDVSFRIAPIDKVQAGEMMDEIKASEILKGVRGEKPVNIEKLVDILMKVSKLSENKKIIELDFNPVIVNETSATIVDARIMQ